MDAGVKTLGEPTAAYMGRDVRLLNPRRVL